MGRAKKRVASAFEMMDSTTEMPNEILAIDPGTRHCGMAWAPLKHDAGRIHVGTIQVNDLSPVDCLCEVRDWLDELLNTRHVGQLVVEGFQLYPGKMQEQGMSRMGTPEVLGAIKWTVWDRVMLSTPGPKLRWSEPGASIKAAGRRYMEAEGLEHLGTNQHKRDAEMHLWYRVKLLRKEAAQLARGA